MRNIRKRQEGITLIALVITIIVLLLLAGISISMLSGQDGILSKAGQAKQAASEAEEYDKMALAVQEALVNGNGKIDLTEGASQENSLDKALKETFGEGADSPYKTYKVENGEAKITLSNGKTYTITFSGVVTQSDVPNSSVAKWEWTDNQEEGTEGHGEISVGDLITHKEKTTEQFYVIKVDGDNVAMLAAKNITTTGTLAQSDSAPKVAFSNTIYWSGTYPLNLNTYIPADATKIKDTDAIEIARAYASETFGVTGRLMTVEEVEDLDGSMSNNSTSACPSFINSTKYWLGSAGSVDYVWYVSGEDSSLYSGHFGYALGFGVRPVIDVSSSSIE